MQTQIFEMQKDRVMNYIKESFLNIVNVEEYLSGNSKDLEKEFSDMTPNLLKKICVKCLEES